MKKNLTLFIAFLLIFSCIAMPANAEKIDYSGERGSINFADIANNPNISVSDIMTFPEMVERYAENEGITYQEALTRFPNKPATTRATPNSTKYMVFSANLMVNDNFRPHLEFYCEVVYGGHFWNINSIYKVQLVRSYTNAQNITISKQFSGDVSAWLRSGYSIEYSVNGDFFNNGTTSVTSEGSVGGKIDDLVSVTYTASTTTTSNHYQYFYGHNTEYYGEA